ncbi:MAG: hypothetical protein IT459_12515 [Planctomycetes bacterium]|nr:hypothetical protein [Planctomycetota bacterium]
MAEPEQLEPWTAARGLAVVANAAIVRRLGRDAIEALALGEFDGEVLKQNPRRRVTRVATPIGPVVVKHYAPDRGLERLKVLAFGNRARREWDTALALRAAGLPVPEPWYLAESAGASASASFGAAAVPGARPLGGFLEDRASGGDAARAGGIEALAPTLNVLARMHAAGFHHRDFHGGNVLLQHGDPRDVVVIDLHRVERGREVGVRARIEALATLLHTLRFGLRGEEIREAILRYAAEASLGVERERFVAAVLERVARREAARIGSRSKRCARESTEFTAVRAGGCIGWRRRNVEEHVLFESIAAAREALAQGSTAVRSIARRSSVALAPARDAMWAVKVYDGDGHRRSLRARFTEGRAGAAYRAGFALAVRDVAAPPVIAWLKTPDRSVLVMTAYDDATTLLAASFAWLAAPQEQRDPALRTAAIAVAELLSSLWSARVLVHDLSPKNVLLRECDGRMQASLCDFDGIRFGRAPTLERMIRGLAQVNDCAPGIPARARLRVLARLKRTLPQLRRTGVASAVWRTTRARAEKATS